MAHRKTKTTFLSILVCSLTLIVIPSSCYYDNKEDLYGEQTCDTINVNYTRIQSKFEQQCYGCHTANAPSGNVAIYDFSSLKSYTLKSKGTLLGSINHTSASPMPKGGQKWDNCTIQQVEAWINQGMKP